MFPVRRMRRFRRTRNIREIFKETDVLPRNIMYPVFVWEGETQEIRGFPGQKRWKLDDPKLFDFLEKLFDRGLMSILVFGVAVEKDEEGREGWRDDGVVQRFVSYMKSRYPDIVIATDVCLCTWRCDGHCGVVRNGEILNDETLEYLGKISLSHAHAGADIVAPSDMMDGRVRFIREKLDENGFKNTLIMSYSAKYASSFYGPFREAAHSAPAFGDRGSYQINPSQSREGVLEAILDVSEGADIIMIKPALLYLDIISEIRRRIELPIAAFNVSGEYSIIKMGIEAEIFDEIRVIEEVLTSIRRAGADIIITYFAPDFLLKNK